MDELAEKAIKNVGDIIRLAIKLPATQKALVVFDMQAPLTRLIAEAYRQVLPQAQFIDFDASDSAAILAAFKSLSPGDLVVLVQSTSFRLDEFRIRIELFKLGLATIEHLHLGRITDEAEHATYVEALAYDPSYYLRFGHALKNKIDQAETITVRCKGTALTYQGGMEPTKLNIGDYTGMKNIGGTFPIGEVFSEPKDFSRVNGEAMIFAFANMNHLVEIHQPFKVHINEGILTAPEAPPVFQAILDKIREDEDVLVREFGLGLNPAMGKHRKVSDITAFERQKGLHLSLGAKHGVYKKPGFNPKKNRYHVDVFVDVERIEMDGQTLYQDGEFTV